VETSELTRIWYDLTGNRPLKARVIKDDKLLKEGSLMVWHIPQVPGPSFYFPVTNTREAISILRCLALYDSFQFENNIKPDYSNASGLLVYERGEWVDWIDPFTGETLDETIWRY